MFFFIYLIEYRLNNSLKFEIFWECFSIYVLIFHTWVFKNHIVLAESHRTQFIYD